MRIDNVGQCIYTEDEAFNLIMQGIDIDHVFVENGNELNKLLRSYEAKDFEHYFSIEPGDEQTFHRLNQKMWAMPEGYYKFDIKAHLIELCSIWSNPAYRDRLDAELAKFEEYNLLDLLRYLKYMVDVFTEHDIIWGVGRGSSVASLCLYLLGVHSVDPVAFDISFDEFLD
jgi:DNA polymerase III alpha subunit